MPRGTGRQGPGWPFPPCSHRGHGVTAQRRRQFTRSATSRGPQGRASAARSELPVAASAIISGVKRGDVRLIEIKQAAFLDWLTLIPQLDSTHSRSTCRRWPHPAWRRWAGRYSPSRCGWGSACSTASSVRWGASSSRQRFVIGRNALTEYLTDTR